MGNSITIPITDQSSNGRIASFIILLVVAIFAGTVLRVSLLVLYPFIALVIALYYRFRITSSFFILLLIASIGFVLSMFSHPFLKYKLLSLFYMLPFLMLLFSNPVTEKNEKIGHFSIFLKCFTFVALVNDVIGIGQVIHNPNSDDSFTGIYSQYSISLNGLMLLNSIVFFCYFLRLLNYKRTIDLFASIFFLACAVLGFYGAGLIICMAAFILSFFRFELKSILRTFFIGVLSFLIIFGLMLLIKPDVVVYNRENLQKISKFDFAKGPRKLTSFYNYAISYPSNAKDFLFGSGPGTFNSRSAFMVGSPSYFQMIPFIKDDEKPFYFEHYAYTLWNDKNTVKSLFLDGFRNQPFSSILAFLGEYGLIFTIAFFWLYYRYYRKVANIYSSYKSYDEAKIYFRFFKFLIILLPMLLLIDNYFEYPEIMLVILLGIKFSHAGLLSLKQKHPINEY